MLSANIACDHHNVELNSIYSMASLLSSGASAIYGPSNDQIKQFNEFTANVKKEIETAKSVNTLINTVFVHFKNGKTNTPEQDTPELLEISAGIATHRNLTLSEDNKTLRNFPLSKAEKRKLDNLVSELSVHLIKIEDGLMDFRHHILHIRGEAPHFRASKKNLLKLVAAANNTNVTDGFEFEEV
jgi:hypothetical protein